LEINKQALTAVQTAINRCNL